MMGWTADDGDALFRQSDPPPGEDPSPMVDGSQEAMRRLRFPFEANPADVIEQQQDVPLDEEDYRD
jgi:hypothetical protein